MSRHHDSPGPTHTPLRLKKFKLFQCLSEEDLSELGSVIVSRRVSKDEVILMEEDSPHYMYMVYSGKVKAVQTSSDGKEHILAVHTRGDFFGEMGLLDGRTAPATVVAMEDTEIGLLRREDFDRHLLTHDRFLRHFILILCSRLRDAWFTTKVRTISDAGRRVHAVLKLMADHHGVRDTRGTIISLRLTHKDIAEHASLSRETVTRAIDKMFKSDEIQLLEGKHFLLKPAFFEKTGFL